MSFLAGFGTGLMNKLSENIESKQRLDAERESSRIKQEDLYQQSLRDEARKEYVEKKKAADAYKERVSGLAGAVYEDGMDRAKVNDVVARGVKMFGEKEISSKIDFVQWAIKDNNGSLDYAKFVADQEAKKEKALADRAAAHDAAATDRLIMGLEGRARLSRNPFETPDFSDLRSGAKKPASTPVAPPSLDNQADVSVDTQNIPPVSAEELMAANSGPVTSVQKQPPAIKQLPEVQRVESIPDPVKKKVATEAFDEGLPGFFGSVKEKPAQLVDRLQKREEALQTVPEIIRDSVAAVADGTTSPKEIVSLRGNARAAFMKEVYKVNPEYTPLLYEQRQKTIKDFGPNTRIGTAINALSTITHHLEIFADNIDELENGDIVALNKVKQKIARETGATPGYVIDSVGDYLAFELARFYTGAAPTLSAIEEEKKKLNAYASPGQYKKLVQVLSGMVEGKVAAIDVDWKTRMGAMADMRDPIGADVRGILNKLSGEFGVKDASASVQPSATRVPSPKAIETLKANPAARDKFDAAFGPGAAAKYLGQ